MLEKNRQHFPKQRRENGNVIRVPNLLSSMTRIKSIIFRLDGIPDNFLSSLHAHYIVHYGYFSCASPRHVSRFYCCIIITSQTLHSISLYFHEVQSIGTLASSLPLKQTNRVVIQHHVIYRIVHCSFHCSKKKDWSIISLRPTPSRETPPTFTSTVHK